MAVIKCDMPYSTARLLPQTMNGQVLMPRDGESPSTSKSDKAAGVRLGWAEQGREGRNWEGSGAGRKQIKAGKGVVSLATSPVCHQFLPEIHHRALNFLLLSKLLSAWFCIWSWETRSQRMPSDKAAKGFCAKTPFIKLTFGDDLFGKGFKSKTTVEATRKGGGKGLELNNSSVPKKASADPLNFCRFVSIAIIFSTFNKMVPSAFCEITHTKQFLHFYLCMRKRTEPYSNPLWAPCAAPKRQESESRVFNPACEPDKSPTALLLLLFSVFNPVNLFSCLAINFVPMFMETKWAGS